MKECDQPITVDDLNNLMGELRGMARALLRSERNPQSLTPTALAISAVLRAKCPRLDWGDVRWENRAHFFSVIRMTMRHALVDHARKRQAKGRALVHYVGWDETILSDLAGCADRSPEMTIVLHDALQVLQSEDEQLSQLIYHFYFAGYSVAEILDFHGPSVAGEKLYEKKIDRNLKKARVLLKGIITKLLRDGNSA